MSGKASAIPVPGELLKQDQYGRQAATCLSSGFVNTAVTMSDDLLVFANQVAALLPASEHPKVKVSSAWAPTRYDIYCGTWHFFVAQVDLDLMTPAEVVKEILAWCVDPTPDPASGSHGGKQPWRLVGNRPLEFVPRGCPR